MSPVPQVRIRLVNDRQPNPHGKFVLYWMIAFRRTHWNFSLQRAVELAQEYDCPLVVFEALRCGYEWASDRLHRFVIDGMIDNQAALEKTSATYFPYLENNVGDGKGLFRALASQAVAIVTDDFPCFFLPKMVASAAEQTPVAMESVDSNGIFPMRDTDRVFTRAHSFRRFLQKTIVPHLDNMPKSNPLARVKLKPLKSLPTEILKRWPAADLQHWHTSERIAQLPIDHEVGVTEIRGGSKRAQKTKQSFLKSRLTKYHTDRNQPEQEIASGLSPYLHFGHISAHQVVAEILEREEWTPDRLPEKATGSSSEWWGLSEEAESFLDELITWREVGYNMCALRDDYDEYESLPEWAQITMEEHARDKRSHIYSLQEFETANTHDELWNAAQRQLVREGRIHNYLRMLWGKKIYEWCAHPRDALEVMIELNNKYALDGRNPNSYSGIFWVLGRYDRAWGPVRPVFGKIRYMSSDNTARKVRVKNYIKRYGPSGEQRELAFE